MKTITAAFLAVLVLGVAPSASGQVVYVASRDIPLERTNILPQTQAPVDFTASDYNASVVPYLIDDRQFFSGDGFPGFFGPVQWPSTVKLDENTRVASAGQSTGHLYMYFTGTRGTFYTFDMVHQLVTAQPRITVGRVDSIASNNGQSLTMLADGNLYLVDTVTGAMTQLLTLGPDSQTFYQSHAPNGLLYLLDYANLRMFMLDPANGYAPAGEFFLQPGETTVNQQFAIGPTGNLYLSDGLGGGTTYSPTGTFLNSFHPPAGLVGQSGKGVPYLAAYLDGHVYSYDPIGGLVYQYLDLDVIAADKAAPLITVPGDYTIEATSASGASVAYSPASAQDNIDGFIAPVCLPASGATFPLGANTVTCTATDAQHNTGTATFLVTVQDTVDPTIDPHADLTVPATSASGAHVTFTPPAWHDAVAGTGPANCVPGSGTLFPVGPTTVTCFATDGHNVQMSTFVVTVTPFVPTRKPPKVTAPKNLKVEATGPAGAVVTFAATATDPVDGALPVTCAPASGSTFPLGATTVTCSATNTAGQTNTDTTVVTVRDTTEPTIVSVTPSMTVLPKTDLSVPLTIAVVVTDLVDLAPICAITKVTGGAKDLNDDGVIDWTITGPLSLRVDATTRKMKDRTYTITVKCTDQSGNSSKQKTAVVVSHR